MLPEVVNMRTCDFSNLPLYTAMCSQSEITLVTILIKNLFGSLILQLCMNKGCGWVQMTFLLTYRHLLQLGSPGRNLKTPHLPTEARMLRIGSLQHGTNQMVSIEYHSLCCLLANVCMTAGNMHHRAKIQASV